MRLFGHEVRLLFWKEVRQLTRSQGVMLSGLLLPAVLVVLAPVLALLSSRTPNQRAIVVQAGFSPLGGLHGLSDVQSFFLYVTLPLMLVTAGFLTPMLAAAYTVISERERHSLELLMALPVSTGDILAAKLIANLATGLAIIVPMFMVDAIVILSLTDAGLFYVLGALVVLVGALVASVGATLVLALTARDFRSSYFLTGALAVPPLLATALCAVFVPGTGRFAALTVLLLGLTAGAFYTALRWLTFERYPS